MKRIVVAVWNRLGLRRLGSRARAEAELDRKEAELRRTIFAIASELSKTGLEARKEMIRQAYLASGRTPEGH